MTASSVARRSDRDNQAQVRRRQLLTRVAPDPHDLAIVAGGLAVTTEPLRGAGVSVE
jgi:hypothetical protein